MKKEEIYQEFGQKISSKLVGIISNGLETAFSMGYYPIMFKPNKKYKVASNAYYIGYNEMSSHKYTIRAMEGEDFDKHDPEIVSYQNMREIIMDGWEPLENSFPQRSEAKEKWLKWMKSDNNHSDIVISFIEKSPDNVWFSDDNFAEMPQWMFAGGGSIADWLANVFSENQKN